MQRHNEKSPDVLPLEEGIQFRVIVPDMFHIFNDNFSGGFKKIKPGTHYLKGYMLQRTLLGLNSGRTPFMRIGYDRRLGGISVRFKDIGPIRLVLGSNQSQYLVNRRKKNPLPASVCAHTPQPSALSQICVEPSFSVPPVP